MFDKTQAVNFIMNRVQFAMISAISLIVFFPQHAFCDEIFGGTRVGVRDSDVGEWKKWSERFVLEARAILVKSAFWEESKIKVPDELNLIKVTPRVFGSEVILGDPVEKYGLLLFEFVLVEIRVGTNRAYLRIFHRMRFDQDESWKYLKYPGDLPIIEFTQQSRAQDIDVVAEGRFNLAQMLPFLEIFELRPVEPANHRQWVSHFLVLRNHNDYLILGEDADRDIVMKLQAHKRESKK